MSNRVWVPFGIVVLGAFLAGTLAGPGVDADPRASAAAAWTPEQREAVDNLRTFSDGFAAIAEAVIPSVVTITSEKLVKPANHPFSNDPFFRRFFREQPEGKSFKQRGLGSGVIVGAGGTILTNNHVVTGATELTVIFHDGSRAQATVIGADARTDLAVLEVDRDGLPALAFGNSDEVRIGEWVLAIGSPFSDKLQATTTAGIVSATGRSGMNLTDYEDFIQTDAAINPGNSGGALVNLKGEVIGINSAIATRTGGSNGIGFAIPANLALEVMDDLVHHGKVTRGWLGVSIQDVTQDVAEAMDLDDPRGVLVSGVLDGSPAKKAGLEAGDVIVAFEAQPVKDTAGLRMSVARADPGSRTDLTVIRDGQRKTMQVNLGEYPENDNPTASRSGESPHEELGLTVLEATPDLARRFEVESLDGLVVTGVAPGSPAEEGGIRPGDAVRQVNRKAVGSMRAYRQALEAAPEGKPVLLLLERGENRFFVALRPQD